jgi:hypothetical protein
MISNAKFLMGYEEKINSSTYKNAVAKKYYS